VIGRAVESGVARALKVGLALSAGAIAVGVSMQEFAIRHLPAGGSGAVAGAGPYPRGLSGVVSGLGHGSGTSVVELGLALLVCTPVTAVAVAALSYGRRGERRLALFGGIVLLVLAVSILVGVGLL